MISLSPVNVLPCIKQAESLKVFAHLCCSTVASSIPGCTQAFRFQSVALSHDAGVWKQALYRMKAPNSGVGWSDWRGEGKIPLTKNICLTGLCIFLSQTSCEHVQLGMNLLPIYVFLLYLPLSLWVFSVNKGNVWAVPPESCGCLGVLWARVTWTKSCATK